MRLKIRHVLFLICFLVIIMVFTNTTAEDNVCNLRMAVNTIKNEDNLDVKRLTRFELPLSLTTIEDEAFEGTAITNIVMQENVETIGDYAFANIQTLKNISISNRTTYIGKNAFKGSANVTITGSPKGYARAWAHENGIPFNPITSFYAFNNSVQVNGGLKSGRTERLDVDSEGIDGKKFKPTGRMTSELNAEKKETITTFHIQGRSPPVA